MDFYDNTHQGSYAEIKGILDQKKTQKEQKMILSLLLDSDSVFDLRHCRMQASSNLLILRAQRTILCEVFYHYCRHGKFHFQLPPPSPSSTYSY